HAPTATDNQFISMEAAKARVLCAKFITFIRKRIQLNSSRTRTRTRTHVQNPNPKSGSFHPSLRTSMSEIIAATENFSSDLIVGYSRFGFVYMAELPSGLKLAVKKLNPYAFQCFMEFRSELEILGKLRHRKVARILGYCVSGADRILLYELHEEGNLDVHRHCANDMSYPVSPLPWETRCKIVMGVAKGLAYMHDLEKPIIHRDVKSSNVLLDSEFGLARIIEHKGSHVSSLAAGTDGYMPPEYVDGSRMANGVAKSFLEWTGIMVAQNGKGKCWTQIFGSLLPGEDWKKILISSRSI
ncbi:Serine/threonine protein kinase, partial [Trema orientale]